MEIINKIKAYIKENNIPVLWVVAIALLAVFFVVSLFDNQKEGGGALIEQPLTFYRSFSLSVPESLADELEIPRKGMELYKVKKENLNIKYEGVLTKLEVPVTKKVTENEFLYQWETGNKDVIYYDPIKQIAFASFQTPISIFSNTVLSNDKVEGLIKEFCTKYFSNGLPFKDTYLEKSGSYYMVYGRREVNGLPLSYAGYDKYLEYIKLDKDLRLKEFKISMVSFEDSGIEKIKLVHPENIAQSTSSSVYPKEISIGSMDSIEEKITGKKDQYLSGVLKMKSLNATSLELVYLFANTNQQFISPTYRLSGEGTVLYNDKEYTLQMSIHANALNPEKVYIPTNIIYLD